MLKMLNQSNRASRAVADHGGALVREREGEGGVGEAVRVPALHPIAPHCPVPSRNTLRTLEALYFGDKHAKKLGLYNIQTPQYRE